jgi:hypothetical protein
MNEQSVYDIALHEAVEHTQGAITERTDRVTKHKVWCARFTTPDSDMSPSRVLWIDGTADGTIADDDLRWFLLALSQGRNCAVRFESLKPAVKFMLSMKPNA